MKRERMSGKERTLMAIRHEQPDRVPLELWMFREDMVKRVEERYGSLDNLYQQLDIDVFMAITPPPNKNNPEFLEEKMTMKLEEITDDDFLDPDDPSIYVGIRDMLDKYGQDKCVVCHVWGVLEGTYAFIGVEEALIQLGSRNPLLSKVFGKCRQFSERVAQNVIDMGIDVLHLTGDVGANKSLIMSPTCWREQVAPFDAKILDVAVKRDIPRSLHSCGYFRPLIDDFIDMGVDIIHPFQQSAGMDLADAKQHWGDKLTIRGGLDLRYYLPRAPESELVEHVKNAMLTCKPGGGFIFDTEHTVQPDTTLDRVELAYQTALEHSWYE